MIMISQELQKKIDRAIKLIRTAAGDDIVEVSYSGGKDSDVILELAKMAGIKFRAIYKNTTIDPPGTLSHCSAMGVEITPPQKSFLQLVKDKGMPTRRARFCCSDLKEYKVLDKAIQGIRRSESTARAKRYTETDPIICRIYNRKDHVNVILPILSWTDEDVRDFIEYRGIKCAPVYYDEQGKFHVERRLGCLGCPMQSDNGVKDFKEHPLLFKAICKSVLVWWKNHPNAKSRTKFGSCYGLIAHNLFYNSYEEWRLADKSDLFGTKTDWKAVLEKQFNITLPDEDAD